MALTCAALLLAASCGEPVAVTLAEEVRHANGLTTKRPDGFDASETGGGFALMEQGSLRSPRFIWVMVLDEPPSKDPASRHRRWNGLTIHFMIDRLSGGSGGDEYELTAWRPANGRWIVVKGRVQTEWGEPGFAVAWAVFDETRIDVSEE